MGIGGYVFSWTLRDFLAARKFVIWLIVSALAVGLGWFWLSQGGGLGTNRGYAGLMGEMGYRLVALVAAVFSTAVVAGEVEQRTIVYLLTRPIPRATLLVARLLASICVVGLLSTFLVLAIGIVNFGIGALTNGMVLRDVGIVWLGAAAYGGLFLFISLLLNRAFLFCLLFAFGWEAFVPRMPGDLYYASIHSHMRALSSHPVSESQSNPLTNLASGSLGSATSAPWGVALAILVGIFIVGTVISAAWFTQFEYTPREDAE